MSLIGKRAPSVTLDLMQGGETRRGVPLDEYRGKWVVLFFYPFSFTGVCGSEVTAFNSEYDQFRDLGAEVIGGSVDSTPTQMAWMRDEVGVLAYPLFSDLRREISAAFGVLREDVGDANRAAFIIDPEGTVVFHVEHEIRIGRNTQEILRVLKALQSGESCEANWAVSNS
jgi:alkyl hydroperoxide reductase subunit AhpC